MRPLSRKEIARIPVLPYLQANQAAAVRFRLLGEQPLGAKGFQYDRNTSTSLARRSSGTGTIKAKSGKGGRPPLCCCRMLLQIAGDE